MVGSVAAGGRLPGTAHAVAAALLLTAAVPVVVSVVVSAVVQVASAADGSTYVVESIGDGADRIRTDGVCNTAPPGQPTQCTLRAAIEQAEATAGHDRIEFAIAGPGPHTIRTASTLPIMYDESGVTIDGYTQPGARVNTSTDGSNADLRIELRGRGPTADSGDGLYFSSSGNVVRGLAIYDFVRHVYIRDNDQRGTVARHNVIVGNFIGTNAAGTFMADRRNPTGAPSSNGVHIENGASYNEIGRPSLADRNVISGTAGRGVGMFDDGTDGNIVRNNVIGLRPTGDAPLKNWAHGIDINYGSSSNVVGGTGPLDGNVISGNDLSGVEISHNTFPSDDGLAATERNRVVGNLIGTDASGTSAAAAFSNGEFGVGLEGKGRCADSCTPDIHDNEVRGNVIVGSKANVMIWKGAHRNVVADNFLGVLADGTTGSGAATIWGVLIEAGAFDNLVADNRIARVANGIVVRPDDNFPSACQSGDTVCPNVARFTTFDNRFTGNSIEHVGPGLGIDLWPVGEITAAPDAALVQRGVRMGVITSASTDRAVVEACNGCVVELFETADVGSSYGQGRRSLGTAVASGGVATFVFRTAGGDPFVVRVGESLSVLVSTPPSPSGQSSPSEFSLRRNVVAGSVGTTTTTTTSPTTTTTTTTTTPTTAAPTTSAPAPSVPTTTDRTGAASADVPAVRCRFSPDC
ncbi:hypothetical protein [Ilumatobacter sp.]|uniref:hypothetical protein n=1 Tax=Ilumatobacter sp. TaxID=1967498 RepID=UPI0032998809